MFQDDSFVNVNRKIDPGRIVAEKPILGQIPAVDNANTEELYLGPALVIVRFKLGTELGNLG